MVRKFRKPYRIKRRKSIFRNRFFWLTLLILIIIGGLFYFLVFSSTFQIKEIQISGESRLEIKDFQRDKQKVFVEDIRELIEKEIERKVLFLPTRSIFLVNLSKIRVKLLEEFPQLAYTNLNRKFPDILLVQVEERKPVAIFCHTYPEDGEAKCFLIDKEGIIFEPTSFKEGEMIVRNLTLKENLILGEKVVEKEKISQILEIESKLKDYNPPTTLLAEDGAPDFKILEVLIVSEERLNIKTSEGWEIYFNPKRDLEWQLTKLKLVLEKRIPEEKRKNVEYIDLRFEKIYIFPETYRE